MSIGPEQIVQRATAATAATTATATAATSTAGVNGVAPTPLLRRLIGSVLRRVRLRQGRTLRDVARVAGVSVPYLSEVERGRKEPSSEVLAAICRALGLHLAELLEQVRDELSRIEPAGPARRISPPRADRPSAAHAAPRTTCAVSGFPQSRNRSTCQRRGGKLHESVTWASSSPAGRVGGGIYERLRGVDARRGAGLLRRPGLRPVAPGADHLSRH